MTVASWSEWPDFLRVWWIKSDRLRMVLGRKTMTNLESILKSRDITLLTKAHLVKAMVFPVVMYGCESWTVKKAECERIDAFELWCWRRLLRVPWTARRSNQSIRSALSIHWKDGCWSWNLTWCEELTHLKRLWCWERLKEGGEWKSWLRAQHSENEDHGIWSHHFMGNRWERVETVSDFIFLGSKITADGDCSHEIKRHSLEGKLWPT